MSSWPEAIYIIQELKKVLKIKETLNMPVLLTRNVGTKENPQPMGASATAGTLWFILDSDTKPSNLISVKEMLMIIPNTQKILTKKRSSSPLEPNYATTIAYTPGSIWTIVNE